MNATKRGKPDPNFWVKYFEVYDFLNLLIPYQELLKAVCDELDVRRDERILEAGCGTGNLVSRIVERGAYVIGVDNCPEALDLCRKKNPRAKLVLADLTEKLPFPDGHFDKIASNNTLYTISKDEQLDTLKELRRVLKRDGRIALSNLRKNWKPVRIYTSALRQNFVKEGIFPTLSKAMKLIFPTIRVFYYNYLIGKESRYYFSDVDEQRELLEQAGFRKVSKTTLAYSGQAILNSAQK